MAKVTRILSTLMLAVIVAISSLQMALARGAPLPVGEMVLCTGKGPVTVAVDAEGNPTGEVHYCPDCAAVGFAALEVGPTTLPRPVAPLHMIDAPQVALTEAAQASICPQSRGPPLSV